MNERTRKKKGRGEFDLKGFEVEFSFPSPLSLEEQNEFIDEFIGFVESISLGIGGGGDAQKMGFFVTKYVRGRRRRNGTFRHKHFDCTIDDQNLIEGWLQKKTSISQIYVGKLVGSNSGR